MKRFFGIILLTLFLFIPNVKADIKSESIEEALKNEGIEQLFTKYVEKEKEETLYLFRTKGEDLSNQFLSYLNRIYEDYGDFFNIKIYEVSGNADNKELMEKAIEHLKIETDTTPIAILDTAYITTYNENVDDS